MLILMLKDIASVSVSGPLKSRVLSNYENETLEEVINRLEFIDVYPWLAVSRTV